jgi:uncharacterized membrane protein YphA (DoxX/SURF4 family)
VRSKILFDAFIFSMRLTIGGVFAFSGWGKLMTPPENFMAVIGQYQFFPSHVISIIATTVPWLELILGLFLAVGYLTRASATITAIFLASFMFLIARGLVLDLPIAECGCFGSEFSLTPIQALTLDVSLLVMALMVVMRPPTWLSLDRTLAI